MNCIDCVHSINERRQCYKANPDVKECENYEDKHLVYRKMVKEMLEG